MEWDSIFDFSIMWKELERIVKPKANLIFFGSQPFTSLLAVSNLKWFRHELIWNKNKCGSPGLAKYRPQKVHENILVFSKESGGTYNPIMEPGGAFKRESLEKPYGIKSDGTKINRHGYGFKTKPSSSVNDGTRYPKSILHASRNFSAQQQVHPTQKPTHLLNWLIMTYSNPGDVVLDFCMGSGSCGVSAKMTGRKFIGIEKDKEYFQIAEARINASNWNCVSFADHQLSTQIPESLNTLPEKNNEKTLLSEIRNKSSNLSSFLS